MAGDTIIHIEGNLTAPPELRFTSGGHAVASFTVASTPRVYDKATSTWKDSETLFMRCSAWRQLAENIAESLDKGTAVVVIGRLHQRSFEKDGQKRTVIELEADNVAPSLQRATAQVTKVNAQGGNNGQQQRPAQQQGGGWGTATGATASDPWSTQGQQQPPF
jgi:single-strand DNA-binding protein